jgi:hypothetical protein
MENMDEYDFQFLPGRPLQGKPESRPGVGGEICGRQYCKHRILLRIMINFYLTIQGLCFIKRK